MKLKKLLYFVLALSVASFADAECERIYHKFIKTLSKQKTKTCRVSGVDDDRTDIMGFFFHFDLQGTEYPAVFIYGSDYDPMLYSGEDYYVKHAKCIKNDRYRILYTVMTPEQIAAKLLSFKNCGDDFNHPANEGPHTNVQVMHSLTHSPDGLDVDETRLRAKEAYAELDGDDDFLVESGRPLKVKNDGSGAAGKILLGTGVTAAVTGVVLAVIGNSQAKSASEKKYETESEFKKNRKDAESGQTLRSVGIGIAIVGAIGIGISFAF